MVSPPEPAALTATRQPGVLLDGVPVPFPMLPHAIRQYRILRRRPWPLLQLSPSSNSAIRTITPTFVLLRTCSAVPDYRIFPFSFSSKRKHNNHLLCYAPI
ncbi:hypothetical protein SLA2020_342560 [Shorea laevis]